MERLSKHTPQLIQFPMQKAKQIDSGILSFSSSTITSLALTVITLATFDHFFGYRFLYESTQRFTKDLSPKATLKRVGSSLLKLTRSSSDLSSGSSTPSGPGTPSGKRSQDFLNPVSDDGVAVLRVGGQLTIFDTKSANLASLSKIDENPYQPPDKRKNPMAICELKVAEVN
ncbi:MAG: hypothetical protein GWP59_07370 [Chlamydiales bacterium]|nr:hypothetical protein [Chlamydiales bacterium]NCF71503.1 hypothetical protein [Chlamydiales bacterium]